MIAVRDAVGAKSIGFVGARDASGLDECEVYVRDTSGAVLIHSPSSSIAIDISGDAYGSAAANFPVTITTSTVNVTPTGGSAPYSYAWARVDDPMATDWIINGPTLQSASFRSPAAGPGDRYYATFACTVTDANGHSAVSATISATVVNYGGLGGLTP